MTRPSDAEVLDRVRTYELSRRDPLIDAWRACHSLNAKGPWYVVEHADLIAALRPTPDGAAQQPRRCGFENSRGDRCRKRATTPSKGTARRLWACDQHARYLNAFSPLREQSERPTTEHPE